MHLDLAVAPRAQAEAAFFDDQAHDGGETDSIPRIRLEGLTEFELAALGALLKGSYEPRLALDGEYPEDVVSECDPSLTQTLAQTAPGALAALAQEWFDCLAGISPAGPSLQRLTSALEALLELALTAITRRHALLYTQQLDDTVESGPQP